MIKRIMIQNSLKVKHYNQTLNIKLILFLLLHYKSTNIYVKCQLGPVKSQLIWHGLDF